MDALCEQIDKLTLDYLEEFGHLLACKQLLDDTVKQGYFNLSRARIIMGVNNLSRLQYSERDPMIAATKISISSVSPFQVEKEIDKEHGDDALKWFGLLSPNVLKQGQKAFQKTIDLVLESCKRQDNVLQLKSQIEQLLKEKQSFLSKENSEQIKTIIRPHQSINEFIYQNPNDSSTTNRIQQQEQLLNQFQQHQDYYKIGFKNLSAIQSMSLAENWPIIGGNAVTSFSSGFVAGMISNRIGRNLCLNLTTTVRPASGAAFFTVTFAHLSAYYMGVLRPMVSDDPALCPTCLEIRAFATGSLIPIALGTGIGVCGNLSSCILNKSIRLPQFNLRAYPEWREFFTRHVFKGMAHRHFFLYPLLNGFMSSLVLLGQSYYWRSYLRQYLDSINEKPREYREPKKRNKIMGAIEDFFTTAFSNKMSGKKKAENVQTGTSASTLLIVAIAGGVIAVSLQPLILALYSNIGSQIAVLLNQQPPNVIPIQQTTTVATLTTTAAVSVVTSKVPKTTTATTTAATTTTTAKTPVVKNDPTVDEEPILLKDEPLTVKFPETTTEKPKEPKTSPKSEETTSKSQRVKLEKVPQQPEIIDVTGRNKEIPDAVKNFKSVTINMIKTKKLWIPIPNSNGGHRRVPPIAIRAGKEHNSSVKHWLFEEFLSHDECINLIKVHKEHVKEMKKIDPIICFDSIQTLRKHLKDLRPDTEIRVTPNDFTKGTTCMNETFSSMLKQWGLKWSYSTAFYHGESAFSKLLSARIEEGTALQQSHGGKFQITSTDKGIGYKAHHDCTLNGLKQDRYATFLAYLNTVMEGGETEFPELDIKIKPKEGRVVVWNNMNEKGECEEKSLHSANIVGDEEGKFVLQRWYYYENFYSLGRRPPEPDLPERKPGQIQVSCDEYDMGSCRAYDEWNYQHILKYRHVNHNLI
ncbi:unnamed protein product [Adineta ricciae]|uniref:Prolyl 4-hydroxylase alpha subunit domain-containing protein n=1 Tax=Adineta ricciae TaxID=249248 RepID=A0A813UHU3_ADIRI|nr:unnamed protein product [Adineta ricciae]